MRNEESAAPAVTDAQQTIKYVGTDKDSGSADSHPNDDEPRCDELRAVFKRMGDDTGQGLHPYWKWAFASGFNEAKRIYTTPQPSPAQHDVKRLMEALKETNVLMTSGPESYTRHAANIALISEIEGRK